MNCNNHSLPDAHDTRQSICFACNPWRFSKAPNALALPVSIGRFQRILDGFFQDRAFRTARLFPPLHHLVGNGPERMSSWMLALGHDCLSIQGPKCPQNGRAGTHRISTVSGPFIGPGSQTHQNTDQFNLCATSSSALSARTELPLLSSPGLQATMEPRPGATATIPPPTPLLQGKPTRNATSPDAS